MTNTTTGALFITVGIPGCGKTTVVEKMLVNDQIDIVVSSDKIREDLTGDMTNQEQNNDVFALLNQRVRAGLATGWARVMVDATNLRPAYRKVLMGFADEFGVSAQALHFKDSADLDLCQKRNQSRLRVVPFDVMQRFHRYFIEESNPSQLRGEGWRVVSIG